MTEQTQSFPGAFCEPCNKWRKPSALMPDGSCPRCRTALVANSTDDDDLVVAGESETESGTASAEAQAKAATKVPWHFWVMVGATCLYLGWRIIQGVAALL